jgi:hypothetical protein
MISLKIEGLTELEKGFLQAKYELRNLVKEEVKKSTYRVHAAAVKRIQQGEKTGEIYEKYSPRRTHQASAPGEAPASDTGFLANQTDVIFQDLEGKVIFRAPYAPPLEHGTADMEARPFLGPSVEEERPKFQAAVERVLRQDKQPGSEE